MAYKLECKIADTHEVFEDASTIDVYNPVAVFEHSVGGNAPVLSDESEAIFETKNGGIYFTTDITHFKHVLDELSDGWYQKDMKESAEYAQKVAANHIRQLLPKEYKQQPGKTFLTQLRESPDLQIIIKKNLEARAPLRTLITTEYNTFQQLEEILATSGGGEKFYKDLHDAYLSDEKRFNKILNKYSENLSQRLEVLKALNAGEIQAEPEPAANYRRVCAFQKIVWDYLDILKNIKQQEFPYAEIKECICASEIAGIKPKDAKEMRKALNKALRYFEKHHLNQGDEIGFLIIPENESAFYIGSKPINVKSPFMQRAKEAVLRYANHGRISEKKRRNLFLQDEESCFRPLILKVNYSLTNPETTQKVFKTIVTT